MSVRPPDSDPEIDDLLAALGPPAGATPVATAAHLLALAAPVPVPIRAGVPRWVLGASVAAALFAGFGGGVVVMGAAGRVVAEAPGNAWVDDGARSSGGDSTRTGHGATDVAVGPGDAAGPGVERPEVGGAVAADAGDVVEAAFEAGWAARGAHDAAAAVPPSRVARGARDPGACPPGDVAGGAGDVRPDAVAFVAEGDDGPWDATAKPSAPDAVAFVADGDAPDDVALVVEGAPDGPREPSPPTERSGRRARPEVRREGAVADVRGERRPTPWSLAFDGGWAAARPPGPQPNAGPGSGPIVAVSARVTTRGPSPVHLAAEVGASVVTPLVPFVTSPSLAPGAAVEVGFRASDTVTPSVGWLTAAHLPLRGDPARGEPSREPLLVTTGPRLGLDLGKRDRAHLRLRLDLQGAPDHAATLGLRPTVALTGGIEVPIGRR